MADHLKIVPLSVDPTYNDIVGQLRKLADDIEKGEYPEVESCICLMSSGDDFPAVFHWGDNNGQNHPVVQLELAKTFLLTRVTSR